MSSTKDDRKETEAGNSDLLTKTEPTGPENPGPEEQYDPGPSFVKGDRPNVRLSDMPAWLQTFAATLGKIDLTTDTPTPDAGDIAELSDSAAANSNRNAEADRELTQTLPDWLSAPRSRSDAPSQTRDGINDSVLSTMISEDDLPEWLRSVGPAGPAAVSELTKTGVVGQSQEAWSVPPVARAWVNYFDSAQLSDGGSAFAGVASQSTPIIEQQPVEEQPENAVDSGDGFETAGASSQGLLDSDARESVHGKKQAVSSDGRKRLFRVVALVLALIILVLLLTQFVF